MASCRSSRLRFFSRAHWPSTSGRMISTTCLDLAESSPLFGCSDFSLRAMPNMPVPRCAPAEDDGVRGVHQATVTDSARGVVEIRSRQQSPVLATIGRYPARPAPARCRERRRLTPAVPGGVSASCLARSLETVYQKTDPIHSDRRPNARKEIVLRLSPLADLDPAMN